MKNKNYDGQVGGLLMEDGVTCVDLTDDVDRDVEKIRQASIPDAYRQLSKNIEKRFRQVCDFDREFPAIKAFLERA